MLKSLPRLVHSDLKISRRLSVRFIFRIVEDNRIIIQGNGHQSRAFIHVDHLTAILARICQSKAIAGVFNLVANNYEIIDLVDAFKQIIPSLEFIFVDQHLELRNLRVNPQLILSTVVDTSGGNELKDDIKVFLDKFSY